MQKFSGLILISLFLFTAAAEKRPAKNPPVPPKNGVKTPGVQIPFAGLLPEMQFATPSNPEWIAFFESIWFPDSSGSTLARIDPKGKDDHFLPPVPGFKQACGGMASGFGSLWTFDCSTGALVKLDPKTAKVAKSLTFGAAGLRSSIAVTADSVWAITDKRTTLSRIDPDQGIVVAETRLPAGCRSLLYAESSLWIACPSENKVLRINPATNLVDKYIPVSPQPEDLAFGANSVWVLCAKGGNVDQIDPKTNKVTKTIDLAVPGETGQIAFGEGYLWVTQPGFPLTRIDPQTQTVAQQFYGPGGGAIQTGGGFLWLANTRQGTLYKIDPKRVLATLAE